MCDSIIYSHNRKGIFIYVRLKRLRTLTSDPPFVSFHKNWVKSGINISKVNWERLERRACVHMCAHRLMCWGGLWDKTVVWQLCFMQFLMHYPVKFQCELLVPRLVADWLPMGLSHNCVVQLQNGTDFICHNSTKQLLTISL